MTVVKKFSLQDRALFQRIRKARGVSEEKWSDADIDVIRSETPLIWDALLQEADSPA